MGEAGSHCPVMAYNVMSYKDMPCIVNHWVTWTNQSFPLHSSKLLIGSKEWRYLRGTIGLLLIWWANHSHCRPITSLQNRSMGRSCPGVGLHWSSAGHHTTFSRFTLHKDDIVRPYHAHSPGKEQCGELVLSTSFCNLMWINVFLPMHLLKETGLS